MSADHHSQKANGLVWGLSTRKMRTPWSIQWQDDVGSAATARQSSSRSRAGRCPGTSWAGSRRTGWCRRAGGGTTRVLLHPGVVGRALEGDVEGDLDAELARRPRRRGSHRACRAPGGPRCGRPRPADRPRAARDRPGLPAGRVVRPLRWVGRWGGSAAGRGRRSPSPRRPPA
jgi:hypothetical protein